MSDVLNQTEVKYWAGPVGPMDDFGAPIVDEFIDGRSKWGPWAMFAPQSWTESGCGQLGTGYGQRYKRQRAANGGKSMWIKVEG